MLESPLNKFAKFGINQNQLKEYDIIFLPENFIEAKTVNDLYDASESIFLFKQLKQTSIKVANALTFQIESKTLDRRSSDKWLGTVISKRASLIILTGAISSMLGSYVYDSAKSEGSKPKVHLQLEVIDENKSTKIDYDGDSNTLIEILKILEK